LEEDSIYNFSQTTPEESKKLREADDMPRPIPAIPDGFLILITGLRVFAQPFGTLGYVTSPEDSVPNYTTQDQSLCGVVN
jgi:hypothetical protein